MCFSLRLVFLLATLLFLVLVFLSARTHYANVLDEQKHGFNGLVTENLDETTHKLETFVADRLVVEVFNAGAEEKSLVETVFLFLNSFNYKVRAYGCCERNEALLNNLLHVWSLNKTAK